MDLLEGETGLSHTGLNDFPDVMQQLAWQFDMQGPDLQASPIGNGHINTTLLLHNSSHRIVVQKLNTHVFPSPGDVVNNALLIESQLEGKRAAGLYPLDVIRHVRNREGEALLNIDGEYWRALEFIPGSFTYDVVENAGQAHSAANAFGCFASALSDMDLGGLKEVIPDFHNLEMRLSQLQNAVDMDRFGRLADCSKEVELYLGQRELLAEFLEAGNELPLRLCHNDTKINNTLFCNTRRNAVAVIDLDTCMPGHLMLDFGDMVRTFCSPEAEDSTKLENVQVRTDIFEAIVAGYTEPLKNVISLSERKSLLLGAKVMCLMIGTRFLTDYLENDHYFSTDYAQHNLFRARNQLALYQDVVKKQSLLEKILGY